MITSQWVLSVAFSAAVLFAFVVPIVIWVVKVLIWILTLMFVAAMLWAWSSLSPRLATNPSGESVLDPQRPSGWFHSGDSHRFWAHANVQPSLNVESLLSHRSGVDRPVGTEHFPGCVKRD